MLKQTSIGALVFSFLLALSGCEKPNNTPSPASSVTTVGQRIEMVGVAPEQVRGGLDATALSLWERYGIDELDSDALLHGLEREVANQGDKSSNALLVVLALSHVEDSLGVSLIPTTTSNDDKAPLPLAQVAEPDDDDVEEPWFERIERPIALLQWVCEREEVSSEVGALARINLAALLRLRAVSTSDEMAEDSARIVDDLDSAANLLDEVATQGPATMAHIAEKQISAS